MQHPQVKRAFELNVDAEIIQGFAGREDWEGLENACAVKVRRVNEALAEALRPKPGKAEADSALLVENAALRAEVTRLRATINDYDSQIAQLTADLEEQQELLRGETED